MVKRSTRTYNGFNDYYVTQAGSGVSNVYKGVSYQRGHGIGSFLAGLFRRALPFIKTGVKTLGKETAKAGLHVLGDVSSDIPIKESLKARFGEARDNIKRKAVEKIDSLMQGSGYKTSKRRKRTQSRSRVARVKKRPTRRTQRVAKARKKITKGKNKTLRVHRLKRITTRDIFT
jgi:hypothetical protein